MFPLSPTPLNLTCTSKPSKVGANRDGANTNKGVKLLVKVSKEVFLDMMEKGFLKPNGNDIYHYITGKSKGKSARKHHYICEPVYTKYQRQILKGR